MANRKGKKVRNLLGISMLMGARDEERGTEARNRIADQGLDAHFIRLDVTDPILIQSAVGRIRDQFGRLDVLVNNAGIQIDAETSILELGIELFQNTLETNVFGPFLLSQACVPLIKANGFVRIVNPRWRSNRRLFSRTAADPLKRKGKPPVRPCI